MRAERLLTLYLLGPLMRASQSTAGFRIPVLMYHSISDNEEKGVHPYYRINTSPKIFRQQMDFLRKNNYSVISISEAVDLLSCIDPAARQGKYAVLTFDDGYQDFYSRAFPILSQYGFTATVYLPTAFIDDLKPGLRGKAHLSWEEVCELAAQGITFGSHTVNHPQLYGLDVGEIEQQIAGSKEKIQARTGRCVASFSYPYRYPAQDTLFVRKLTSLLVKHGYSNGVTTTIGTGSSSDNMLCLRRLPVNSCDDARFFTAKLRGDYDWVGIAQHELRRLRAWRGINGSKHAKPSATDHSGGRSNVTASG